MSTLSVNRPLEPCPNEPLNGQHDWVPMQSPETTGASGNPLPGARFCLLCSAVDYGPLDLFRDNPSSLPPPERRRFPMERTNAVVVVTHNPDDPPQ